jgi:1,4-dihydroxy-2-naphthoate polyprenyltransferase
MEKREMIQSWVAQVRGNFLVLSVLLVAIGLALAGLQMKRGDIGPFSVLDALLVVLGVVITHVSVNLFNEYSDYKTGIDAKTQRTPFSGGSGMMLAGKTDPLAVSTAAWQTLFLAFLIGLYFVFMSHWFLLVIMVIGAISIVYYTGYFARWLLGELFAGLSLGSLVVIGTYIAMTGSKAAGLGDLFPAEVVLISIPPGILTALLLYLNEFPDAEADREGGRFHLVIFLGKKKASYLYVAGLIATYVTILLPALLHVSSWWVALGCLTIPLAAKSGVMAIKYCEDTPKLVPALGINVVVVLATDLLLAIAIVMERAFS